MPNKYDDIVKRIKSFNPDPPRPPLTEEQLNELEAWHGYALPADYREFLRDYGGIGANAAYPLKDSRRKGWDGGVFVFFDIRHLS
ncbi:SMI1/KNR4 family protein [bacterium]|nr:MAG: SMI1/KNR4 family protein [bacterium]